MEPISTALFVILAILGCVVVLIVMLIAAIFVIFRRRSAAESKSAIPVDFSVPPVGPPSVVSSVEAESAGVSGEVESRPSPEPVVRPPMKVILCASCGASQEATDDQTVCAYCGGTLMPG